MKNIIIPVLICLLAMSFNACDSKKIESETKNIEATQAKNADSSKNAMVDDLNAQLGVDTTKKKEEKKK